MSMLSSGQFTIKVDASTVAGIERRMLDAQGRYRPNPCSFYLLNLAIDVSPLPFFLFHYVQNADGRDDRPQSASLSLSSSSAS
jgi:hypothetical protein